MAELNKILLIGRLTRDPELRYTPGGMAVADFRMAVNHTYRVKEEKREEVCLGVKIKEMEADLHNNFGVKLIPEKNARYHIQAEDALVVVAVDET